MGACLTSAPEEREPVVKITNPESPSGNIKSLKTNRKALARYYLKFPRINKAYKHLFYGWSEAIGKSVSEGASAAEIFNLEGPRDKVSEALDNAGLLLTNDDISNALKNADTTTTSETTLRFKHLIIAVCEIIKANEDGLKPSKNDEKYDEIKNGFKIVQEMFAQIDVDGSGEISLAEFTEAFSDLSHGDDIGIQEKRMAELDFNNDKEISYPEFCVGLSVWVGFVHEFE